MIDNLITEIKRLCDETDTETNEPTQAWLVGNLRAAIARHEARTPTDDERTSEEQEEQRRGDRGADHEEQQTDDRATAGGISVGGGHASMMPQATSDGKRVISHTPTDDEREALRQQIAYRVQTAVAYGKGVQKWGQLSQKTQDAWIDEQVALAMNSRAVSGFRRTEVPEPSAETEDEMHARGATAWDCNRCGQDPEDCYCGDEPQDEPSDARVLAALNASHGDIVPATDLRVFGTSKVDKMRAALRAAGVVR